MKNREKKQKGELTNLNYPPKDMPLKELKEWWDPSGLPYRLRRKKKWKESDAKPSPL